VFFQDIEVCKHLAAPWACNLRVHSHPDRRRSPDDPLHLPYAQARPFQVGP